MLTDSDIHVQIVNVICRTSQITDEQQCIKHVVILHRHVTLHILHLHYMSSS